ARILHDRRIDPIALLPRCVDDEGKRHRLVLLLLHCERERRELPRRNIVADALPKLQGTVLLPDLAGRLRHLAVGLDLALRHRHDESIDIVRHLGYLLRFNRIADRSGTTRGTARCAVPRLSVADDFTW